MFETDRLPPAWVKGCNRMDEVWVPSEFNRETFAQAGVAVDKLRVIPGCLDPAPYRALPEREPRQGAPFRFLTLFDWTLHKGWDVPAPRLPWKPSRAATTWSWCSRFVDAGLRRADGILRQAAAWVKEQLDHDLFIDPRIRFVHEHIPADAMPRFYREADAYVMPSRGEAGAGRISRRWPVACRPSAPAGAATRPS